MDPLIFRGKTWRISFLPFSVRKRSAAWVLSSFHNVRHRLILSQNPRNVNLIFVSFFFSFPGNFKNRTDDFLHLFQNRDSLSETFLFPAGFVLMSLVLSLSPPTQPSSISLVSSAFLSIFALSQPFVSFLLSVTVFSALFSSQLFFFPVHSSAVLLFFSVLSAPVPFSFFSSFFHSLTAAPAFFSGTPKR